MYKNVGLYSCYFKNIPIEIVNYQRYVFEKFNLYIQQDELNPSINEIEYSHGYYLNNIVNTTNKDYIIFFDIDCIPLKEDFYDIILEDMCKNILSGAIGCANHIDKNKTYIHPCFMGFSMNLYKECKYPDLSNSKIHDVAQNFTDVCNSMNKQIKYWEITDSGDEYWDLIPRNSKFGHGTIFENMIYHQYECRYEKYQKSFVDKCKSILYQN